MNKEKLPSLMPVTILFIFYMLVVGGFFIFLAGGLIAMSMFSGSSGSVDFITVFIFFAVIFCGIFPSLFLKLAFSARKNGEHRKMVKYTRITGCICGVVLVALVFAYTLVGKHRPVELPTKPPESEIFKEDINKPQR